MQQPMHSYVHGLWYKFEVRQFENDSSDPDSNKSGKIKKFWPFSKSLFSHAVCKVVHVSP